jgi:hypothetical protein
MASSKWLRQNFSLVDSDALLLNKNHCSAK